MVASCASFILCGTIAAQQYVRQCRKYLKLLRIVEKLHEKAAAAEEKATKLNEAFRKVSRAALRSYALQ